MALTHKNQNTYLRIKEGRDEVAQCRLYQSSSARETEKRYLTKVEAALAACQSLSEKLWDEFCSMVDINSVHTPEEADAVLAANPKAKAVLDRQHRVVKELSELRSYIASGLTLNPPIIVELQSVFDKQVGKEPVISAVDKAYVKGCIDMYVRVEGCTCVEDAYKLAKEKKTFGDTEDV